MESRTRLGLTSLSRDFGRGDPRGSTDGVGVPDGDNVLSAAVSDEGQVHGRFQSRSAQGPGCGLVRPPRRGVHSPPGAPTRPSSPRVVPKRDRSGIEPSRPRPRESDRPLRPGSAPFPRPARTGATPRPCPRLPFAATGPRNPYPSGPPEGPLPLLSGFRPLPAPFGGSETTSRSQEQHCPRRRRTGRPQHV